MADSPVRDATRARARTVVEELFGAALGAVEPAGLVFRWLERNPLPRVDGSLVVAGLGKAAHGMVRGVRAAMGPEISRGIVVVPREGGPVRGRADGGGSGRATSDHPRFRTMEGGHPLPDLGSVEAGEALLAMARELEPSDLLLLLLSGGGSALATVPLPGISLDDLARTTELLLGSGAPISEVNAVRRGLDALKGGGLARAASPARVVTLAISDVVGDLPVDVASGPAVSRPDTDDELLRGLAARGVGDRLPDAVRRRLGLDSDPAVDSFDHEADPHRPRDAVDRSRVEWHLVGSNRQALAGVRSRAVRRGWLVHVLPDPLTGEAREVGRVLAGIGMEVRRELAPGGDPVLVVAGGETTVTVRGPGRGGRNQEVALGAALTLADGEAEPGSTAGVTIASLGTDGVDGPTDAAGAVADASTVARSEALGASVEEALRLNDSYPLLRDLGDLVFTGPTGTNVMDVFLVLVDPSVE